MMDTEASRIVTLAEESGIALDRSSLRVNRSGLDFFAVIGEDAGGVRWVLRAPRREDVVGSAAYERRALDLVRDHLPVAVPRWRVHQPELIAYPALPGVPAATINAETQAYEWSFDPAALPEAFIESLAATLVALHGIDPARAGAAGLRVHDPSAVRAALAERMGRVREAFGVEPPLWERWRAWLADDSFWPSHSALVHGDLHPGHTLVDDAGRITGLLDWTECEVSDPAIDFVAHCTVFGEPSLATLIERYRQRGGRTWPRMHAHIVERTAAIPVFLASFALRTRSAELMSMAERALSGF